MLAAAAFGAGDLVFPPDFLLGGAHRCGSRLAPARTAAGLGWEPLSRPGAAKFARKVFVLLRLVDKDFAKGSLASCPCRVPSSVLLVHHRRQRDLLTLAPLLPPPGTATALRRNGDFVTIARELLLRPRRSCPRGKCLASHAP